MRHLLALSSLLVLASCSGGGCSGCTGSLPRGATPIANAAAVRISRPGLDFLEANLGALAAKTADATDGVLAIGIPETPVTVPNIVDVGTCPLCLRLSLTGSVCPGGPDAATKRCTATVNLGASTFALDAVAPGSVSIAAVLPLTLDDTAVTLTVAPLPAATAHLAYGANATCTGDKQDTPSVQPRALPVTIRIPLVADPAAPHATKVDIDHAVIDLGQLAAADVAVCADCGPFAVGLPGGGNVNVCNTVLNAPALKNALVTQLKAGLDTQLKALVRERVPALLGGSMHLDLASAVGAFSPATTGGLDLGLVPFGSMSPAPGLAAVNGRTGNGITLGMLGGAIAAPLSRCVTPIDPEPPTGIPIPDELAPTVADPAGTPHVGFALSGRFLEYAATHAYDSGLFCLGTTTAQVSLLKVSILSLLVPSLKTLTFAQGDAAAAIATRPGAPPKVTVGTSPLVTVTLPRFAVDFYVWSYDRYARVFTYTADLSLPLNLTAGPTGLVPAIGDVKVDGGAVSNADLTLLEDPAVVGGAVSAVFGTLVRQLVGGSSSPIDLGAALAPYGLALDVATVKALIKDDDAFVGVFGNLRSTAATARQAHATETMATLSAKRVFADHLQLGTYDRAFLPELDVDLAANDDAVEYSWWIDRGTRAPFASARHLLVKDDQLFMQGRHELHVVARRVGEPASEDPTPVSLPFVIDAVPPVVTVAGTAVHAWDLVSTDLVGRLRVGDGAFGAWQPVASLVVPANTAERVDVEVRDEEGNIGRAIGARTTPWSSTDAGCGCAATGSASPAGYGAFAFGGLLVLALLRRRRAAHALAAAGLVAACGSDHHDDDTTATTKPVCGTTCDQACRTDLGQGVPGSYLAVARGGDGAVWAAGYNDTLAAGAEVLPFGDLVVGRLDLASKTVDWKAVDGLPTRAASDGCSPYDPRGWRSGETGPGDDVGRFASLAVTTKNQPIVTYYDDTNHRLKLAIEDGGWKVAVLREQAGADIGRASKILVVDGKPVIAFMQTEPGSGGNLRAKIVLARATTESPHEAADFAFSDIAVQEDAALPFEPSTYPRALGAYLAFANGPGGPGLVAYDGAHDQLVALRGDAWTQTVLAKGGVSPSLAITADGAWHVAYRSGDTLRYQVDGTEETVDDGASADGLHKVGDDAVLRVDDGVPTLYYADSTALGIKRATKVGSSWTTGIVPSPNRWTAFPQVIPGESAGTVAAWWRASDRTTRTVTGGVTVLP